VFNYFLPVGKKITYHEYFNRFKADHIFFNLASGDEIASDVSDLMVFIQQTSIPFSVFYHSLSKEKYLTEQISANFRYLLDKSKNNFFTSQIQIELLQEQLNCIINNARIVNHPLRKINDVSDSVSTNVLQMCIIGSLVNRWKGQDTVISILAKVKWRHRNWHLNIYGDGPDREEIEKLIAVNELSVKVTLHNHNESINDIFKANDLVLIPSKQDSGPIVLFESMLAGRPVVGSFIGAIPDYIKLGENGVLAKGTDEISFENAMEFAWQNKDKWNMWGKKAREKILLEYDFNSTSTLLKLITTDNIILPKSRPKLVVS
jgi:glycosyltransferase involved in cell wall biosynthesis